MSFPRDWRSGCQAGLARSRPPTQAIQMISTNAASPRPLTSSLPALRLRALSGALQHLIQPVVDDGVGEGEVADLAVHVRAFADFARESRDGRIRGTGLPSDNLC